MRNYRKSLIAGFTFFGGLYFFLEFVLPKTLQLGDASFEFGKYHEQISLGVAVVGNMAIGLGILNILFVHGGRCLHRQKGWINSFALLAGLGVMFVAQSVDFLNTRQSVRLWRPFVDLAAYTETISSSATPIDPQLAKTKLTLIAVALDHIESEISRVDAKYLGEEATEKNIRQRGLVKKSIENGRLKVAAALAAVDSPAADIKASLAELQTTLRSSVGPVRELVSAVYAQHPAQKTIKILYDGFFTPLGSAMFSLLAFYIAHAAYRSFRLRSVEAAVLMITAIIIILGQIPQGPMYVSEHLPAMRLWLMENVNTPGNRAIYFGSAIAGLAMAVRMWFSMEKSPLDADDVSGAPRKA